MYILYHFVLCIQTTQIETNHNDLANDYILVAPSIRAQSTLVHSTIGKSTNLRCSATAPYDTLLYWRRIDDNDVSSQSNRYRQQQHIHGHLLHIALYIKDIEASDFGIYACYAESRAGQSKAIIELKEYRHPLSTTTNMPSTPKLSSTISQILAKAKLASPTATTLRAQLLKRNKISDQTADITNTNFVPSSSSTFILSYQLILILFFLYL